MQPRKSYPVPYSEEHEVDVRHGCVPMRINRRAFALLVMVFAAAGVRTAAGQSWDTSGNAKLSGTYYFREVAWLVGDSTGGLAQGISVYGTITFNGNGTYTVTNATVFDSNGS